MPALMKLIELDTRKAAISAPALCPAVKLRSRLNGSNISQRKTWTFQRNASNEHMVRELRQRRSLHDTAAVVNKAYDSFLNQVNLRQASTEDLERIIGEII